MKTKIYGLCMLKIYIIGMLTLKICLHMTLKWHKRNKKHMLGLKRLNSNKKWKSMNDHSLSNKTRIESHSLNRSC